MHYLLKHDAMYYMYVLTYCGSVCEGSLKLGGLSMESSLFIDTALGAGVEGLGMLDL